MCRINLWITIILCVYLLTFSGRFHSIDEMSTFVTTESLAKHATLTVEQMRWATSWTPPQNVEGQDGYYYSKKGVGVALLAVPFYALGLLLPSVGLVQTVMLMGVVLTIGSAIILAAIVRQLGYSRSVSLAMATIFAFATPAWHYSRTIFDTSATTFCWLLGFWALLRVRQSPTWQGVAGIALGASVVMKSSNIVGVIVFLLWDWSSSILGHSVLEPGKCIVSLKQFLYGRFWLYLSLLLTGTTVLGANWLRFGNLGSTGYLVDGIERFTFDYVVSLPALLFSPGKGIFVFAPPLLAALLGWRLFWQRQRQVFLLIMTLSLANVLLYGAWFVWWGPWSWGPRFLIPLVPFLLLPLAEVLVRKEWLVKVTVALCIVAGVWINMMGVLVDPTAYLTVLLHRDVTELDTIWSFALWPPLGALLALIDSRVGLDIAWSSPELMWVPWALTVLALLGLGLFLKNTHPTVKHGSLWISWGIALLALGFVLLALPAVAASNQDVNLRTISGFIAANMEQGDVVHIDLAPWGVEYFLFISSWMNHYKAPLPYTATIRGEASERLLQRLAQHQRVWLILPGTPPAPSEAASETERWWAERAAFLDERWIGQARVVRFVPVSDRGDMPTKTVAVLGDAIELLSPTITRVDDLVIVGLPWKARRAIDRDLRVFVQLLGEDGLPIALHDRIPQSGFAPTTTWQPNRVVIDRYALPFPAKGRSFQLIAGFYDPATNTRLAVPGGGEFVHLGNVTR